MKLTDEMIKGILSELYSSNVLLTGQEVFNVLTAYHKILSSTEPDTDLVEIVARRIVESTDGPWDFLNEEGAESARVQARAAIRAIFGGE